jgi:hypothetical protein
VAIEAFRSHDGRVNDILKILATIVRPNSLTPVGPTVCIRLGTYLPDVYPARRCHNLEDTDMEIVYHRIDESHTVLILCIPEPCVVE